MLQQTSLITYQKVSAKCHLASLDPNGERI